ncbi:MAG: RsmB/NOP family class I SAM-dependent RNA methyltransferase [Nitrososphaerota archaeon]
MYISNYSLKDVIKISIEALKEFDNNKSIREALYNAFNKYPSSSINSRRLSLKIIKELIRRRNVIKFLVNKELEDHKEIKKEIKLFLEILFYKKFYEKISYEETLELIKIARKIFGYKNFGSIENYIGKIFTISLKEEIPKKESFNYFCPEWFIEYTYKILGRKQTINFLKKIIEKKPTYIRINTLMEDEEKILSKISLEGVKLIKDKRLKYLYKVESANKPLSLLTSYKKGFFIIEDFSSIFCIEALKPMPGEKILDICAAPGIKTSHIAQLMNNNGMIISIDSSYSRIKEFKKNMEKLKVKIALPILADATKELPIKINVDKILVDPPCSNTGALWSDPSLKWIINYNKIKKFSFLQEKILDNASNYVKNGGIIIYSTCSITIEENERVIEKFLRTHPDFSLEEIDLKIGSPGLRGLNECKRLYPHLHECNGFFIAKLKKE